MPPSHHSVGSAAYAGLGLLPDLGIQVSQLYVARSQSGQAIDALHGRPVTAPRPGRPAVDPKFILWHGHQVFKRPGAQVVQRHESPGNHRYPGLKASQGSVTYGVRSGQPSSESGISRSEIELMQYR